MLGKPAEGEIKLKCTERSFPEFPNLLFGTQIDNGNVFFDATFYIQKKCPNTPIQKFFGDYRAQINSLCNSYGIRHTDFCKINEQGHYLIDCRFTYLFLAFVEPDFLAYMCDRTHELFAYGIVVSDTYLVQKARKRLTREVLIKLCGDEGATEED